MTDWIANIVCIVINPLQFLSFGLKCFGINYVVFGKHGTVFEPKWAAGISTWLNNKTKTYAAAVSRRL